MQLVSALEHMRQHKIAHRDIKPENIMLNEQFHLILGDFGTAKFMTDKLKIEKKGTTFVGTAEYVSPEVLLDKESGYPSDLWALGCILYNFFAGKSPFNGKTEFWTFNLIIKGEVSYPAVLLNFSILGFSS